MFHLISVSLGHDELPCKYTFTKNKQMGKTSNIATGIMGPNSIFTGGFAYSKVDGMMTQAADNVVSLTIQNFDAAAL